MKYYPCDQIKDDERDGTRGTCEKCGDAYKSQMKNLNLGDLAIKGRTSQSMLNQQNMNVWTESGSGYGQVVDSCIHGIIPSSSAEGEK
jgi:hypothetical protein